jgi:GT2 family glycosyltransferase/glycosyltransferase involved in cell wall biosynthesis
MMFLLRRLLLILLTVSITPLLALLAVMLLYLNLIHLLTRFTRKGVPYEARPLSGHASIVILNWNGKELLTQGIPSVLDAVQEDGLDHEILVVDNGSTDGSVEYLREEFPQVRVIPLPENLGFAAGNNIGVDQAQHDTVILLNNDMVVDRRFLRPLLEGFGPSTFAVSSQIYLQDASARREETGKTTAYFRRGMIDFAHCALDGRVLERRYYPALWAGGGSSAFNRERFLALGGFQEVYSPAYVEDTDLSYQAWKFGWEVLFAPESIVYHKHRASSNRRFSPDQLQALIQRNQFLFIWKNIRDWRFLLLHCLLLPWTCYRLARDHGVRIWKAVLHAAGRFPSIAISKLSASFRAVRSDAEIFRMFENPALYFAGLRALPESRYTSGRFTMQAARPHLLWVTAYLPHVGRHAGAGRMYQLLRRLSRHYRITLLTFLESESEQEFLPEVEPFCRRVVAIRRRVPGRWQLFAYEPFEEFRTPEMEQAFKECLEDVDFDLIQLEYSQMACYASKDLGIPTLLTKHEVDFAACLRRVRIETRPWTKIRWFYNYLQVVDRETRLTRNADGVICMTEPDARELKKFCSSVPIHVINTGVDLDYFQPPAREPDDPSLVFVGAFQHLPNVDAMIFFCREIFPLIRVHVPDTKLIIVGSNPPPSVLDLGEIPGIQVTGFVPDIRPAMAAGAVYIVPLRLGVGIRGKILEAWSMARAVVATSIACAGLRHEAGKNLLVADDAALFARHVVSLLRDPVRRASLGNEGRKTAERYYGWETAAHDLDSLYQHYLGTLTKESLVSVAGERSRA